MRARRWTFALAAGLFCGCGGSRQPLPQGEAYFRGFGCINCHRIGTEGGTYAPDLTFVGFRKSRDWLDLWLKNPHAWKNNTVMPNFHLPDQVRESLVEYLSSQKGQAYDKTGRPWETLELQNDPVKKGEMIFNKTGCVACHGQNGTGGYPNNNVVGGLIPSLTLVSEGYTQQELTDKIRNGSRPIPTDPGQPPPMMNMPKWGEVLKDGDLKALAEYLYSLHPKGKSQDSW